MRNKYKNGFTMVELLIAMVVGLTILLAVYSMMDISQKSSSGVGRRVLTQQDARAVLDLMAMEISMASFNPTMTGTTWTNNSCACVTMTQANRGIPVANATQIGVAMDLDNSSTICNGVNEYISYAYNATNGTITRNVNCGGNEIILGGTSSSTMVRNQEAGVALFQYLDITGAATATIANIRRIRINIIADVETQQSSAFRTTRRTYTTDVLVRNHAMQQ